MTFVEPQYLTLFIIVLFFLITQRYKNYTKAFLLRLGVLSCLIIALCAPVVVKKSAGNNIIFCADISKSIPQKERNELYSFLRNSRNDIIFFSDKARLSDNSFSISAIENSRHTYTSSKPVTSMLLSMLSVEKGSEAVFFTDGNFIDNDIFLESIEKLNANNITVHIYPLSTSIVNEIIISEPEVFDNYQIKVSVYGIGNPAGAVLKMISYEGDNVVEKEVSGFYDPVVFVCGPPKSGFEKWSIKVFPKNGKDFFSENNKVSFYVEKLERKKILYVSSNSKKGFLVKLLGDRFDIVEVNERDKISEYLSILNKFDCILLDDVPAYWFTEDQMKLIESTVRDFGLGLVMNGLYNSFTLGGYHNTPIEKLAPVEMTLPNPKKTEDFFILIDKSGSMAGDNESKYHIAVNSVDQLLDNLSPQDRLSVSVFDVVPDNVVPLNKVENLDVSVLNSIQPHGGTDLFLALQHLYELVKGDVKRKGHCIVLTDGQTDKKAQCLEIAASIKQCNKTLSVIGLADKNENVFLNNLARNGGGRSYLLQNLELLPNIFLREKNLSKGESIVTNPNKIMFNPDSNMYPDIRFNSLPFINAHTKLIPKENVNIPFSTIAGSPLLAYHRYGLGVVSVFMSDIDIFVSNIPTDQDLLSGTIFKSVFEYTLKKEFVKKALSVDIGYSGLSVYSVDKPVSASVTYPDGKEEALTFSQSGDTYSSIFFPRIKGTYNIKANYPNGNIKTVSYSISYSPEYKRVGTNWNLIYASLLKSKGHLFDSYDQIKTFVPQKRNQKKLNLSSFFIIIAFVLFLIELIVRRNIKFMDIYNRVHNDGIFSLFNP